MTGVQTCALPILFARTEAFHLHTGQTSRARGPLLESPETFSGPKEPFVKLRSTYSLKLVFSYVVKGWKIKITLKLRVSRLKLRASRISATAQKSQNSMFPDRLRTSLRSLVAVFTDSRPPGTRIGWFQTPMFSFIWNLNKQPSWR